MYQLLERSQPRSPESRLQRLERRYRRIQNALVSATASHEAMREEAGSSERQLERSRLQVEALQRQLSEVLESLERAEDQEDSSPFT